MMGMNSSMMSGGSGVALMFFGWLLYVLVIVVLVLGIASLLKYLQK